MFVRLLLQIPAFFGLVLRFGIICLVMGILSFFIGECCRARTLTIARSPMRQHAWEKGGRYLSAPAHQPMEGQGSRHEPLIFRIPFAKSSPSCSSPDHIEG